MLLERNQFVIGLVAIIAIAVGTFFAVGATSGLFVPGFKMEAEFTDAAGLKRGDFVFVAGVRVGQVTDVRLAEDHVVATFAMTAEGVPDDSSADIILQSTLGKRALRIEPGTSRQYFGEGDRIPMDRTGTPVDLPELGDRSAELLGEVNVEALQGFISALADITDGNRSDVEQLLDGVERVSTIIVDRRDELERVIDRAQVVVDAAADQDQEIIQIIDSFGTVLDTLLDKRNEITRLLVETADTSTLTADLVSERRAQLDKILAELREDLEIIDAHQVDLAHAMAYIGVGFDGFASIGYQGGEAKIDNPSWGNVFVTGLGAAGIDALLGCGSQLDQALTQLIGPDPACEDSDAGPQDPPSLPVGEASSGAVQPALTATRGIEAFFRPVAAHSAGEVAR